MVQEFQILRCFCCEKFQVHQTKKSNKWQCKVCGEKQSLKKAYFVGSARDCRTNVQQLNFEDGKRKLDCMLEQNNKCSEDHEENSYFESVAENKNINCFDECESVNKSLRRSLNEAPVCDDDQTTLQLPKKKQRYCIRYEQKPLFKICKKDVLIPSRDKDTVCEIEQNTFTNQNFSFHEKSISFDVSFGEHSLNSITNEASKNTNVSSDLKIEDEMCLTSKEELPSKKSAVSKNRGFQLIMNAAKKLSVDLDF